MRPLCPPRITRKRLVVAALIVLLPMVGGWVFGRFALARWAVERTLTSTGLHPASFEIHSVGFTSMRIEQLSIGSPTWLQADQIHIHYSPLDLLRGRVDEVSLDGAVWNVALENGEIDLGYSPRSSTAPISLNLPLSVIRLNESVIRVSMDGGLHTVPVQAVVRRSDDESIRLTLHIEARGWRFFSEAGIENTSQSLFIHSRTRATDPSVRRSIASSSTADATMTAQLKRAHADGSFTLQLEAQSASIATSAFTLTRSNLGLKAQTDSEGALNVLRATLDAGDVRAGHAAADSISLDLALNGDSRLAMTNARYAFTDSTLRIPTFAAMLRIASAEASIDTVAKPTLLPQLWGVGMTTTAPVSFEAESLGLTGSLPNLAVDAHLALDGFVPRLLNGTLAMNGATLEYDTLTLSDAGAALTLSDPESLDVDALRATLIDGSTVDVAPFSINPRAPAAATRITIDRLSLAQWLPLLTDDRATGEGRISGYADIGFDWTGARPIITSLAGSLRADPPTGYIQVSDADAFGELLDSQDPRFATDPVMRPVRDKIVAAMQDFAFHTLTAELSRTGRHTNAVTRISGFGRHGEDPQGINLTLDLHVSDSFLALQQRITSDARLRDAAQNALEDFFSDTSPAETDSEEAQP